jgi:GNAT superfamily N-acetyltransferase
MTYIIEPLTEERLKEKHESFLQSLTWLKWDIHTECDTLIRIFRINKEYETIFVVTDTESGSIVGSIRAILDHKYIRRGGLAGRIEDVSVDQKHQGKWLGKLLLQAAMTHFQKQWCYKVTLACDNTLVWFYEKFGFSAQEVEMKIYL